MKTPAETIRKLREENKSLKVRVSNYIELLRRDRHALDLLNERFSGFAEAVHLLAPHVPAPKEKGKT